MTQLKERPVLASDRIRPLRPDLVVLALAVNVALLWWMNSAWFLKSSSLRGSNSIVESSSVPAGEWRYFGIDIEFTNGTFRGTTAVSGKYQVTVPFSTQ